MINNLIWDLDGTLFDTYPSISAAFEEAVQRLGGSVPRNRIMPLARISFDHCVEQLSAQTGLDKQAIFEEFSSLYANIPPEVSPPFPSTRGLCTWAVVTGGKNVIVTHRQRITTEALLDAHKFRELLTGWITYDDGLARKPDPQTFLTAFERFDVDPSVSLAIGDRDIDLEAAESAGVAYTCAYGPGPFNLDADFVVQDFDDLLLLLKNQEK